MMIMIQTMKLFQMVNPKSTKSILTSTLPKTASQFQEHDSSYDVISYTVSEVQRHDPTPNSLPKTVSRVQKHNLAPDCLPETVSRDQKHDPTVKWNSKY